MVTKRLPGFHTIAGQTVRVSPADYVGNPIFEDFEAKQQVRSPNPLISDDDYRRLNPFQRYRALGGNPVALETQRLSSSAKDPSAKALWQLGRDDRRNLYGTYKFPEEEWDNLDDILRNAFEPRGGASTMDVLKLPGNVAQDFGKGILYTASENLPRTGAFRDIPRFRSAPTGSAGIAGVFAGSALVPPPVTASEATDLDILLGSFTFLPPVVQGARGTTALRGAEVAAGATSRPVGQLRPVLRGATGGVHVPSLPNFDEIVDAATHDDVFRSVGKKVSGVGKRVSGENVLADSPFQKGLVGRRALYAEGDMRAMGVMGALSDHGTFKNLFPEIDEVTGVWAKGPLKGKNVNDVAAELPKHQKHLTEDQIRWIKDDGDIFRQLKGMLEGVGLKIDTVDVEEGGIFLSRQVAGRFDANGNMMDAYAVRPRGLGGTRKTGTEFKRGFKTQEQGLKSGYRYLTQEETTALRLRQTYRRVADLQFRDYVMKRVKSIPLSVEDDIRLARDAARLQTRRVEGLLAVLGEAARGGTPPPASVRAAMKAFPEVGAKLKANSRVTIDDILRSAEEGGEIVTKPGKAGPGGAPPRGLVPRDPVEFPVPKPGQLRKMERQLEETIIAANANPKNQALLKKEMDLRRRLAFAKTRVARSLDGKPPLIKEFRPSKALVAARREAIEELRDLVLGTPEVRRTTRKVKGVPRPAIRTFRKDDGLLAKAKKAQEKAEAKFENRKKFIAQVRKDASAEGKFGVVEVQSGILHSEDIRDLSRASINLFEGRLFTGEEGVRLAQQAQAYLDELKELPGIKSVFRGINAVNAIPRMLVLAGDISTSFIQLMGLLAFNPKVWGKSFGHGLRSMADPNVFRRFLRENQDVWGNSTNLILSHHSSEFTEALRGRSILRRGPLRPVGAVLEPFQRFFDTSLDTAGIMLRKSLVKDGMSAKEIYDTERFINIFRGLTDTQRIGIGTLQQQAETLALLAPRYRRATIALYADILKGGRSGDLARRALASTAAATMATFTALDASVAGIRGQSFEEWWEAYQEKLDPLKPGFLTTEIFGARIGPGPKIVSDFRRAAQVAADPDNAAEITARWYRGQSSPVVRTVWDVSAGENIIGEETRSSLPDFLQEIVAPNVMTIWSQGLLLEGGSLEQRVLRASTEFVGGRARPRTLGESLDFYVQQLQVDARGRPVQNRDDAVREWNDLEPSAKGAMNRDSVVRDLRERFHKDSREQRALDARDEAIAQQEGRDAALLRGEITPDQWRNEYYNAQAESRGRADIIEQLRIFGEKEDLTPEEESLQGYYDIMAGGEDPETGIYQIQRVNDDLDRYLASLPPSHRSYVERNVRPNATETVRDFQNVRKIRDISGWYTTHRSSPIYRAYPAIASLYETYLDARREGKGDQWLLDNPRGLGLVRTMDKWEAAQRVVIRRNNPELDAGMVYWYGMAPASDEGATLAAVRDVPERQLSYFAVEPGGNRFGDFQVVLSEHGIDTFEELAEVGNEQLRAWAAERGVAIGGVRNPSLRLMEAWDIQGRAAKMAERYEEERY